MSIDTFNARVTEVLTEAGRRHGRPEAADRVLRSLGLMSAPQATETPEQRRVREVHTAIREAGRNQGLPTHEIDRIISEIGGVDSAQTNYAPQAPQAPQTFTVRGSVTAEVAVIVEGASSQQEAVRMVRDAADSARIETDDDGLQVSTTFTGAQLR